MERERERERRRRRFFLPAHLYGVYKGKDSGDEPSFLYTVPYFSLENKTKMSANRGQDFLEEECWRTCKQFEESGRMEKYTGYFSGGEN